MIHLGAFIRYHRVQQNLSQDYLSHGICVVSYLSKIESGSVLPSEAMSQALLSRLKVSVSQDIHQEIETLIKRYFDCFFHFEDTSTIEEKLDLLEKEANGSLLMIDYWLYKLYTLLDPYQKQESHNYLEKLAIFESKMPNELAFLYHLYHTFDIQDKNQALKHLALAWQYKNCSRVLVQYACFYYKIGLYEEAVNYAQKGYDLACDEGHIVLMQQCTFYLITCYCEMKNFNLALNYQKRLISLARYHPKVISDAYYNVGASYLQIQDYKNAQYYLDQSMEMGREGDFSLFLLYHKYALLYLETGQLDKMIAYIAKMEEMPVKETGFLSAMLTIVKFMSEKDWDKSKENTKYLENFLASDEIENMLGFQKFHERYLVKSYLAQRRYKEAFELGCNFPVKGS